MKIWLFVITSALTQQFVNAASVEDKADTRSYPFKDYHKEFEEERKEAEAKGFAEGKHDGLIEAAKNMNKAGFPREEISKLTTLSLGELTKILPK